MPPRSRHPEVVAVALIVILLAFPATPGRVLPFCDDGGPAVAEVAARVMERVLEVEIRLAERLARLAERLGTRLGTEWVPSGRLR